MSMLHEITAQAPRNKRKQRKGRGESSGRGKTSGKGNKGAKARAGGPYWIPGHEGGQTKLFRRFPKRGFSNHDFARRFHIVNLSDLEARFEAGDEVTPETLVGKGLAKRKGVPVKVLAKGELSKKLTVRAHGFSASAREAIEAAGGTAETIEP